MLVQNAVLHISLLHPPIPAFRLRLTYLQWPRALRPAGAPCRRAPSGHLPNGTWEERNKEETSRGFTKVVWKWWKILNPKWSRAWCCIRTRPKRLWFQAFILFSSIGQGLYTTLGLVPWKVPGRPGRPGRLSIFVALKTPKDVPRWPTKRPLFFCFPPRNIPVTCAVYIIVQIEYSKEERLMELLVSKKAGLSFHLNSGQFQMFFKVMERMLGYISHSQIPAIPFDTDSDFFGEWFLEIPWLWVKHSKTRLHLRKIEGIDVGNHWETIGFHHPIKNWARPTDAAKRCQTQVPVLQRPFQQQWIYPHHWGPWWQRGSCFKCVRGWFLDCWWKKGVYQHLLWSFYICEGLYTWTWKEQLYNYIPSGLLWAP